MRGAGVGAAVALREAAVAAFAGIGTRRMEPGVPGWAAP